MISGLESQSGHPKGGFVCNDGRKEYGVCWWLEGGVLVATRPVGDFTRQLVIGLMASTSIASPCGGWLSDAGAR